MCCPGTPPQGQAAGSDPPSSCAAARQRGAPALPALSGTWPAACCSCCAALAALAARCRRAPWPPAAPAPQAGRPAQQLGQPLAAGHAVHAACCKLCMPAGHSLQAASRMHPAGRQRLPVRSPSCCGWPALASLTRPVRLAPAPARPSRGWPAHAPGPCRSRSCPWRRARPPPPCPACQRWRAGCPAACAPGTGCSGSARGVRPRKAEESASLIVQGLQSCSCTPEAVPQGLSAL